MAIQDEITRLQNAKSGIASQIKVLGAEVPSDAKLDEYPDLLGGISDSILEKLEQITYSNQITLTTAWVDGVQTVSCTGITSQDRPTIALDLSAISQEDKDTYNNEWNKVIDAQTNNGSITFYASEDTEFDIQLLVKGK